MTIELEDRYVGCLAGLGAGDALGAPLAYMGAEQIRIKHGVVRSMIGGGWLGLRPGETTDETALVLALGKSLAEKGQLDPEDVAGRYRAWLRSAPKDVGATTRAALEALEEGRSPKEAATRARDLNTDGTAGRGTLVRAVPVALLHRRDPARAIGEAAAEASLTHADPLCHAGSAAMAALIVRILSGETDRNAVVDGAYDDLERHGGDLPVVLPDPAGRGPEPLRPTRNVVDDLEAAVVVWHGAADLEACLVRAVHLGGCADTVGALAGALAGATWGGGAIPPRWVRAMADAAPLARLARSLLTRSEAISR